MRTPQQFVIPLRTPLRGVTQADPAAPLPPLPRAPVKVPPAPEPPPPPPSPPPPVNFWETEVGRRLEEDRTAIQATLAGLTSAVNELREQHRHQRDEMQRAVVELAVTLATRLLHDRIQEGNLAVENLARDLLDQLPAGSVTIYLHPEDLALLEKRLGGQPLSAGATEPRLIADPTLGRGDCRAEGGDVLVLSQLEVQLSEMRSQLLRSIGHART